METKSRKTYNLGTTFFDVSVNSCQICMGFEANTSEKVWKLANFIGFSKVVLF